MGEPNNIGWYVVKFLEEDTIEAVTSNWLNNFENCVWLLHTKKNKIKWLLQLNKKKIQKMIGRVIKYH